MRVCVRRQLIVSCATKAALAHMISRLACACVVIILAAYLADAQGLDELSPDEQFAFTRLTLECNSRNSGYEYRVFNFFRQASTQFKVELLCDGEAGPSVDEITLGSGADSKDVYGTLTIRPPTGSVKNRVCLGQLLVKDPFPKVPNSNEFVKVNEPVQVQCGNTVVAPQQDRAISAALDDDDSSAWDLQAAISDGRYPENPVLYLIVTACMTVLGAAIVTVCAVNKYLSIVSVAEEASSQGSSLSRKQSAKELDSHADASSLNGPQEFVRASGSHFQAPNRGFNVIAAASHDVSENYSTMLLHESGNALDDF